MIPSTVAARQLERLSGLDFFPREAPAKKELRLAIECSITEQIAASVVSEWLTESNVCPKPAEIRRLINSRQEDIREQRRNCPECDGVGFVTRYYLATYHGITWGQLRSVQRIADYETSLSVNEGLRNAYASPTPPTMAQQVISAAAECGCRSAS